MSSINLYELSVLRMVAGETPWEEWGAWIGACLEFLKESGHITGGFGEHKITEKGRACLAESS